MQADGIKTWKLRKAPKSHWSNIPQYEHTALSIAPFVDKNGRPYSGLSKEDASRLEKKLGMEENELSPRSPFWRDFFIKVDTETLKLDLDDEEDELALLFLQNHPLVAFGHNQLKKKSKATYILYNDVDEAKSVVKQRNVKKVAYAKFNEMDTQEMIDVLMVLGKRIVSTDPSIIESMMGLVVEKTPSLFVDIAGDKDFKMKLFVMKCIHYDILGRSRGKTLDEAIISFGDEFLGEGIGKVVTLLNAKTNQKLYLALQKRLETAQAAGTLAGAPVMSGYDIEEAISKIDKGEKKQKERGKISNRSSTGEGGSSVIKEMTGEGLDSGDYDDDAPEII